MEAIKNKKEISKNFTESEKTLIIQLVKEKKVQSYRK